MIVITCFIYIRAGREIYRKHRQLKDLNYNSHFDPEPLLINNPFNTKTTEVTVSVSEAPETLDMTPLGLNSSNKHLPLAAQSKRPAAYSVSISARPVTASTSTSPSTTASAPNNTAPPQPRSHRKAAIDANNAAWSYTKVAMLFFTAMLVTWIPSSANRLYSLAADGQISLPLEYMSAFVLPLQGFWNAIIYCVTSWKACKMLGEDVAAMLCTRRKKPSSVAVAAPPPGLVGTLRNRGRMGKEVDLIGGGKRGFVRSSKGSETESMEELANRSASLSLSV